MRAFSEGESMASQIRAAPATWSRKRTDLALFILMLAPNVIFLGIFVYWPLISQAYLSLTAWDLLSPEKLFVGTDNYTFLFSDPSFHKVLRNTAIFVVSGIVS